MKIIAHRGASRECPENTLRAFQRAMEIGVDGIETDVQQTADGRLILFHDDQVKDASGKNRAVTALAYADLETLHAGEEERIPALEELLTLASGKVPLCLELKHAGLVPQVLALVRRYGLEKNIHLTSFLHSEIREVRRLAPQLCVSVTFAEWPGTQGKSLLKEGIEEISLSRAVVSLERVAELKKSGLRVRVYTVNGPEEAARLEAWGVDAIFTDDPRLMQGFRK